MKFKLNAVIFLLFLFLPVYSFAQMVKIVDLDGEVTVKKNLSAQWENAKIGMSLNKSTELETKENAFCTLAFDEAEKNIVTVKQNSRIKIESIKPGNITLPSGRVFSLIKNLAQGEKFEVRTPTAIAGARGTGWGTNTDGANTTANCFEDTCYVQGLDGQGNITGERDLTSGNGINVGPGGSFGNTYGLGGSDNSEWNDFSGYVGDLTGGGNSQGDNGALQDSREDQRQDLQQEGGQQRRQDTTTSSTSGSNDEGGGDEGGEDGPYK